MKQEIIDLSGPQGNAFYIMGAVIRVCKAKGMDPNPILEKMKSSDYDNLIEVVERELEGDIVFID
jgi:uncharacterized ferritin-like protein (DUF455 family)